MKSSLIPEKPLLVYPSLAATVGLEEATMLAIFAELADHLDGTSSNGYLWYTLERETVEKTMPFWSDQDVQRVSANLRDQGIILIASAPYSLYGQLKFAFNEKASHKNRAPTQSAQPAPTMQRATMQGAPMQGAAMQGTATQGTTMPGATPPAFSATKNFIAPNWQPNQEILAQLAQHNIPSQFALEQVPEFVTYWRERGDPQRSWGSKFIKHVIHKWRNFETFQVQREQEVPMTRDWRPSADAMEVLTVHAGISRDFIEDAIPEFVLYWQERGDVLRTWNSKFIQHVRRQWLRYNSALEHDTEPRRIPADWQASEDVYDVLRLANIDLQFARELLPEFVLYWRDSNQAHVSWNTRFLQHVKYQWAKRHALGGAAGSPVSMNGNSKPTRELSLEEQLNDRSWAS
jgi:hypothetical protein